MGLAYTGIHVWIGPFTSKRDYGPWNDQKSLESASKSCEDRYHRLIGDRFAVRSHLQAICVPNIGYGVVRGTPAVSCQRCTVLKS